MEFGLICCWEALINNNNLSPDIHIIRAATNKEFSLSINLITIIVLIYNWV